MTSETRVTVAIPTFNRAELLKISIESVLSQDYPDFCVLVLDNASSDNTEAVVRSCNDSRITYVRNTTNIGLFRNWNRAIELNTSPFLNILQDDDQMISGFISESVLSLEKHPKAAFSVAGVRGIDINGIFVQLPDDLPPKGLISGLDYLHGIVAGKNWVIHASSVMMRSSALSTVGCFDNPHSKHSIDLNLYLRLAAIFDIVFIRKELSKVRLHEAQDSQLRFHVPGGTGQLATMSERTDAIAYLLKSERSKDASYRKWLANRLLHISMCRSELVSQIVPDLNLSWTERLQIVKREIAALIPAADSFILVEDGQWGYDILPDHRAIPFIERDGQYWGPPPDDKTAIQELERLRKGGASFIVFGWPTFWWLDYYTGLRDYLSSKFSCVLENSRLIVFDFRP
jgi:glycosyltransferase involved in cell wall biosynthesis